MILGVIERDELLVAHRQRAEHPLTVSDDLVAARCERDHLDRALALEDVELVARHAIIDLGVRDLDHRDELGACADLGGELRA